MIAATIRKFINKIGYDVTPLGALSREDNEIIRRVRDFTMTGPGRLLGVISAVRYLFQNNVPGDLVECGVWRGGSMMAAALTLLELGDTSRDLYLFDTFAGLTTPTAKDVAFDGETAEAALAKKSREKNSDLWCIAGLEDVRKNLLSTGYPAERLHFIEGDVEQTLPAHAPEKIAMLRLDTDWYESTRHELAHLYPRLVTRGVLIIDDYGHWQGARKAVDEYFAAAEVSPLLNRLDYTGRIAIKC